MQQMYSNATVWWTEREIAEREALVAQCVAIVRETWCGLNPAVRFTRVETPILTAEDALKSHRETGFPLLESDQGVLRPETTAGCVRAFEAMFPQRKQRLKRLPFCVWQFGKSFRTESNPDTMRASHLRLNEFHQLEFQLFAAEGTMAPYLERALSALVARFGGESVDCPDGELPHYSQRTLDWEIDGLEVAGCSERTDWPDGMLFEVSIGIDRLLVKTMQGSEARDGHC